MRLRPAVANGAWLALSIPHWLQFRQAITRPAAAQQRVLQEIETACLGTPAMPRKLQDIEPRGWQDVEELVARAAAGERDVLSREAISHFEPTSGSSAARKLIPSTPLLRAQFNRAIHAWVFDMYSRMPGLLTGPSYWSISPAARHETTSGGIPVGYDDDSEYLGMLGRWLVAQTLVVPPEVRHLSTEEFLRATLLFMLAQPALSLISVWNPTFLTALMERFDEQRDRLTDELARGVVVCGRRLQRKLDGQPWPRLQLISCWADGHAASQVEALRTWFPDTHIAAKGLIATEAFISLPFRGGKVLAVTSHYLELETDDGRLLRVDELQEGDEGTLVVSTGGGLVRYRLGDRIAITAFVEKTPCIDFLGRGGVVSDLCGEKLNEAFVSRVTRELAPDSFSLLVPTGDGYTLYTDGPIDPERLEHGLAANPHYEWAVGVGQLQPVRVVSVGASARATYLETRASRGQRLGDIKPVALDTWQGWHDVFAPVGRDVS